MTHRMGTIQLPRSINITRIKVIQGETHWGTAIATSTTLMEHDGTVKGAQLINLSSPISPLARAAFPSYWFYCQLLFGLQNISYIRSNANFFKPTIQPKMIIIELFAGVGGFRLGLEGYKPDDSKNFYSLKNGFKKRGKRKKILNPGYFITGFANQFEPSTKVVQHAVSIYKSKFKDNSLVAESVDNINANRILKTIEEVVPNSRLEEELILVGGFPCQDYSVAGRLDLSKGMHGKKGILWWNIFNLLQELKSLKKQPRFILLENVDRLLKSPVTAKGKDFTTILHCLHYLGYNVEYMVINAGEYGFPQRRKRVFIMASLLKTNLKEDILRDAFPFSNKGKTETYELFSGKNSLNNLENSIANYNAGWDFKKSPYLNYGKLTNGKLSTCNFTPYYTGKKLTLENILQRVDDGVISRDFFISEEDLQKWELAKGASKIERIGMNRETGIKDYSYQFSVGKMSTFDSLKKPIRTIITSEGGKSPSRTKHLIEIPNENKLNAQIGMRRLTPLELERANCFPDNFTLNDKVSDNRRAFLMGNALVVGVVEQIRNSIIRNYDTPD